MKIDILGIKYTVKTKKNLVRDDGRQAEINYIKEEILIDEDIAKSGKVWTAVFHEVIHGIFEQLGFEEENENEHLIQSLASSMYQVFVANKGLFLFCLNEKER